MTPPRTFRPAAALALAAGLALASGGCGKTKPTADNPPTPPAPEPGPGPGPGPGPNPNPGPGPKPPEKVDPASGVGKEAVDFLQAVRAGTAKASQLSPVFVKMVGLPAALPSDKAKGYSADAAEGWLRRVGDGTGFGLPLYSKPFSTAVVFKGPLVGKPGGYFLRMVNRPARPNDPGVWQADWLSLSSVEVKGTAGDAVGEFVVQEFAATAVLAAICDKDAMPKDDRIPVIAAGLTPAYRAKLAPPFDSDKAEGFDYNRGALALEVGKIGDKAESVSFAPQGEAAFRAEVTRAGGAKAAYLVKLAKGPAPGEWLVESITPQ